MKSTKVFRGLQMYAALVLSIILFFLLITPVGASNSFEGECAKSEPYCKGTKKYISGAVYTGEFKYGKEDGFGELTWKDGSSYVGSFKDGLRHGEGIMKLSDDSRYEGQWEKGLMHGNGTYNFACGHVYTGQWVQNEMSGTGKIVYATGDVYEGGMMHGRSEGKGKVTRKDGSIFAGVHRMGERLGEGMIIWDNGLQLSGNWDYNFLNKEAQFTFQSGLTVITNWASGKIKKNITIVLPNGSQKNGQLYELANMLKGTNKKGFKLAAAAVFYGIAQEYVTQEKEKVALEWLTVAKQNLGDESPKFSTQIEEEIAFIGAIQKTNICW